ncbi:hypothetical protein [Micromonospora sp. NPDC049679]|uniref:hypothetical protein n=1 Tax=Micromonospora sp. NPDC049679 TaxID=3155920 RepID=UPI003406D7B6
MRLPAVSRYAVRRKLVGALLLAVPVLLAGCGGDSTPSGAAPSGSATATGGTEERAQLAGLVALGRDSSLTAFYTLSAPGQPDRTVGVTRAVDGSWRIDIPGGALGGDADVSVAQNSTGLYQCALPSATNYLDPACVRVGDPGAALASGFDPRIQHAFTDWQEVLTDRQAPISVSTTPLLPGVRGSCFSVESTSASLNPALDVGIYCYEAAGTLTGAKLGFGSLVLAGPPTAAPPTVTLPAPVVDREPLNVAAPAPATEPTTTPTSRSVG